MVENMVKKGKDGAFYFELDKRIRIYLHSCEIHAIELKEEGNTTEPKWAKKNPQEIVALIEDGLKYRKLKEAKKLD